MNEIKIIYIDAKRNQRKNYYIHLKIDLLELDVHEINKKETIILLDKYIQKFRPIFERK